MINTNNISKAYSEVYEFINVLGENYKNKIPETLFLRIETGKDKEYKPIYDINQSMNDIFFSREALSLISALNLKYWCEDEEEKERLKKVYTKNQEIEEEKYSYDSLFNNNAIQKEEEIKEQTNVNMQMIKYKNENVLIKIINKIKSIFKRLL